MLKKLAHSKYTLPIACLLVLILVINYDEIGASLTGFFSSKKPPLLKLDGATVEVAKYQYLGSWILPDGNVKTGKTKGKGKGKGGRSWRDAVGLSYDNSRKTFQIDPGVFLLNGSIPRQMTPDSEAGIFKNITWQDNQVSIFTFRALSPSKQTVIAEIDTDNSIALYINGKYVRELSAVDNVELGTNLLVPVSLEAGENVFTAKILSSEGPPRFRMALILDQSKDFQTAWSTSWGFLSKLIYNQAGDTYETPALKWDNLLNRMTVDAEIYDILNGRSLFKLEALRSGNLVRDGGRVLGEGIYKITHKSRQPEQEVFEETFLVGSHRKMLETLTKAIEELPWSASEKLNVEAQLRRAEILFRETNYKHGVRDWEEKVLWTLGNLAEFVNLKKSGSGILPLSEKRRDVASTEDIFKGMTNLRLRGFISAIDNSRQFYRLFVPTNRKSGEKLPLLIILPTGMANANERSFLESPFVASHNRALQVCAFAEKYGFAVLWPGFRSTPAWWTYESVHAEEALRDVEKNHAIDSSKISLYGTCAGGFYAGRLASIWPNRFASIVYDRAVFDRDARHYGGSRDSTHEWIRAINPSEKIIANKNIKIIVLNDGSRSAQHGDIRLSRQFLQRAQAKRSDVKHSLGQRKIGLGLWNMIFEFLADCKNENPDNIKADIPAASGYTGPISEVFATPFIVVKGGHATPGEKKYMDDAIENLQAQYREQFFGAEFVIKTEFEVTQEDMESYSLVLVGNVESNVVWAWLACEHAGLTPYEPTDDWTNSSTQSVFAEVFKHPANKNRYLLLMGSDKLSNLPLLRDFYPFTADFDSYVYKYREGREREYITARKGR